MLLCVHCCVSVCCARDVVCVRACVVCGLGRGGLGVGVIPYPCPGRRSGGVALVVYPYPCLSRRTPGRVAGGVRPGRGIVSLGYQMAGALLGA